MNSRRRSSRQVGKSSDTSPSTSSGASISSAQKKRKTIVTPSSSSINEKMDSIQLEPSLGKPDSVPRQTSAEEPSLPMETIPKLPFEVLIHIMRWLSATERSSSRLVCREWYNACSKYENEEKLSIGSEYRGDNFNEVLLTLRKSARRSFHLEIYGINFGKNPRTDFWKTCGPKILSLKLIECKLTGPPFACILKYCSKLEKFALHFDDLQNIKEGLGFKIPSQIIPSDLKNLAVQTLEICFERHENYYATFWIRLLRSLFDLFPNIANFSFCHYDLHCGNDCGSRRRPMQVLHHFGNLRGDEGWNEYQAREALYKYLARDQMKSIAMNFLFYPSFLYDSLATIKLKNVTEIAVDWDLEGDIMEFVKFAKEQINLRKVTGITKEDVRGEQFDSFVSDMLKIPSLQEFQLFLYDDTIRWNNDWSTLLNESNVKILRIVCIDFSIPNTPNFSHPRNKKLTTLAIRVKNSFGSSFVSFLETFPNLQELCLSHVNGAVMESICENQVELQSLALKRVMGEGALTCTNLANRLKRLRKLEVPENLVLKDNHFDELKTLSVMDVCDRIYGISKPRKCYFDLNSLQIYRKISASLEAVWIDNLQLELPNLDNESKFKTHNEWFIDVIVHFISEMKNLKLLCLGRGQLCLENIFKGDISEEVSTIFDRCPSLRVFVHTHSYVRNIITKRIEKSFISGGEMMQRYMKVNEEFEFHFHQIDFN